MIFQSIWFYQPPFLNPIYIPFIIIIYISPFNLLFSFYHWLSFSSILFLTTSILNSSHYHYKWSNIQHHMILSLYSCIYSVSDSLDILILIDSLFHSDWYSLFSLDSIYSMSPLLILVEILINYNSIVIHLRNHQLMKQSVYNPIVIIVCLLDLGSIQTICSIIVSPIVYISTILSNSQLSLISKTNVSNHLLNPFQLISI